MDPQLWSFFPEDLVDRVLAWLPLSSIFRLRAVCRTWNIITHTRGFVELYALTPSSKDAWILIFADRGYRVVSAYIPTQNKWHNIPLSFLPFDISDVTVAGGLLVFRLHEANGGSSVCVCNPVTSSWRKLPPMLGGWRDGLLGLVIDKQTCAYKIIVRSNLASVNSNGAVLRTEVYDSTTNLWICTNGLEDGITTGYAYCKGVLYFMTWETRSGVYGVYAYNLEQGTWSKVHVPIPDFMTCPHVVECQERLLMVGGFGRRPHFVTEGICVWELQPPTRDWVVVQNMPEGLFRDLLNNSSLLSFNCVGHGDRIFLSNRKTPRLIVIFDCADNSWQWVNSCVSHDLHPMYSWFSYYPRLDAAL